MATRKRGQLIDGVLLLDKSDGMSSNHALQRARRTLDARKAGHTGTLDPFATGLLVCCFGRATKISATMLEADKAYEATLQFGQETDSGDLTGNVVSQAPADFAGVTLEALEAVLPAFRGPITQVPPMYSALKLNGQPLYKMARQGVEVERAPRPVTIHSIDILAFRAGDEAEVELDIRCTKGTYIRSIAVDLGAALGCGGHVKTLHRSAAGLFDESQCVTLEALEARFAEVQSIQGDAAASGNTDGSSTLTLALTLSNSGVSAGSYGANNKIPVVTLDAKGRVISAQEVTARSAIQEYAAPANFPATGETDLLYIATVGGYKNFFVWNGTGYTNITAQLSEILDC